MREAGAPPRGRTKATKIRSSDWSASNTKTSEAQKNLISVGREL
jgi:hypothetical protein